MKRIFILLILISLMSCGHYKWFIEHKKELCCCDTVKVIIYKQLPYYEWNHTFEYVPYFNFEQGYVLDSTLIIKQNNENN